MGVQEEEQHEIQFLIGGGPEVQIQLGGEC